MSATLQLAATPGLELDVRTQAVQIPGGEGISFPVTPLVRSGVHHDINVLWDRGDSDSTDILGKITLASRQPGEIAVLDDSDRLYIRNDFFRILVRKHKGSVEVRSRNEFQSGFRDRSTGGWTAVFV